MSDFKEMRERAFLNAEMKDVYMCNSCKGAGSYQGGTMRKCVHCGGSGEAVKQSVIGKLKEEVLEFHDAFLEGRNSDIERFNECYYSMGAFKTLFEQEIKDTEGDELADIVIVCLAASKKLGIDLHKHIEAKLRYNEVR